MPQTDCGIDLTGVLGDCSQPCESTFDVCVEPATFMVWSSHHIQGCEYSGYRCDIHKNMLILDWQRKIDAMRRGIVLRCLNCCESVNGYELSDHFRCLPL